jgi:hypothetical protein
MGLFFDGTAGTEMYWLNGEPKSLMVSPLSEFSGYFPFKLMPEQEKGKILIIGAGGG